MDPSVQHPCSVCGAPAPLQCSRCERVAYCGQAHQFHDWKRHKVSCNKAAASAAAAAAPPPKPALPRSLPPTDPVKGAALMAAVLAKHLERALKHIDGADLSVKSAGGTPILGMACHCSSKIAIAILQTVGEGLDPNARGYNGNTPLMLNASDGESDLEVLRLLLERGADINAVNENGETALSFAVQYEHEATAIALLDAGADVYAGPKKEALLGACRTDSLRAVLEKRFRGE